ncbi:site-specific integrase [Aquipseudomonas alcaligenes]|uniref:Tyr recombinase domain-containing protein n=2 Tax=Aquipseudomonas alcaligenes TaxID=43263 RepID=U3BDR0_AQUA1|nr:site-specific integrase [Pseudomonas alcaligenes]GAD64903.1 hypothetical protein PA6_053_00090 [Pseudomonas alcaligenes NBRC 14159]SIP94267.1 Phage integrase family protein [Pseudomonas alcaligenes]SUD13188.1 integrase family protein [Pseudomonas alcaligenes]
MSSQNRISVSWVEVEDYRYAVAYDSVTKMVDYNLLDYSIHLAKKLALSSLTVRNMVYHVTPFLAWISENNILISHIGNHSITKFRDDEQKRLVKRFGDSVKAHKRTVNSRLVCVYQYLVWLQWKRPDYIKLIGPDGQVTSNLVIDSAGKLIKSKRRAKGCYPLLFSDSGSSSRHRSAYEATEQDCDDIKTHFLGGRSSYIAARNILMMDIMSQVSLRRGSVNSLRVSQFMVADDYFEKRDFLTVVPDSQKFGYKKSYKFPPMLTYKIQDFIETHRATLIGQKNVSGRDTQDRIFLSHTTGLPLSNSSVTGIFSSAFESIGVTERASAHAFRHKYANDRIHDEILERKEAGLDTSDSSIAYSVAPSMGQSNPESLLPYVSRAQIKLSSTLRKENLELKELREDNARLRKLLKELQEE